MFNRCIAAKVHFIFAVLLNGLRIISSVLVAKQKCISLSNNVRERKVNYRDKQRR